MPTRRKYVHVGSAAASLPLKAGINPTSAADPSFAVFIGHPQPKKVPRLTSPLVGEVDAKRRVRGS
jgi:hypothetical protein